MWRDEGFLRRVMQQSHLNRTSFSGKMKSPSWGYRPKRSLPPDRWKERIIPCGKELEGIKITNLDFEEVITAPPEGSQVLIYIDPPYFRAKQESHYVHPFKEKDHVRLVKVLRNTPYKFFLTYDDVPEIHDLYEWAYIYPVQFFYRLDNSQNSNGLRQLGFELVITNYPLEKKSKQKKLYDYSLNGDVGPQSSPITKQYSIMNSKIVKSPFRFPGSKAQAIKYIRPFWELYAHDEFREPFLGGGAVFFAKPNVRYNWINDISNELIITYKIIANPNTRKQLIKLVSKEIATKERHIEMKEWEPKTDLEVAYKYFYLNRTSYSGIMKKPAWGYHPKKSVPPSRWGPRIESAGLKLNDVKITSLDYHEVIEASPQGERVFMFIDPPYYEADQKRAYEYSFTVDDHIETIQLDL